MPVQRKQLELSVDHIKQHKGQPQVGRGVKVQVPGKHFPGLQPAEQKEFYEGTAMEYAERHKFPQHLKAWGSAHTGPGIRFVCEADALDDPNHKGFWTTLALWNRWRHETYKDDRAAELQYLDELPAAAAQANQSQVVGGKKVDHDIKLLFTVDIKLLRRQRASAGTRSSVLSSATTTTNTSSCGRPTSRSLAARPPNSLTHSPAPLAPPSTPPTVPLPTRTPRSWSATCSSSTRRARSLPPPPRHRQPWPLLRRHLRRQPRSRAQRKALDLLSKIHAAISLYTV